MTAYSTVFDKFKYRIESDRKFFNYVNLLPEIAEEVVNERCVALLDEAIALFTLKCVPKVDLNDRSNEGFNADLNGTEIFLLSSLMYQQYLERDIAKLKAMETNYTATNLRVFDPSNARLTFLEMYDKVCIQNDIRIDAYASHERDNTDFAGVDYSAYSDVE